MALSRKPSSWSLIAGGLLSLPETGAIRLKKELPVRHWSEGIELPAGSQGRAGGPADFNNHPSPRPMIMDVIEADEAGAARQVEALAAYAKAWSRKLQTQRRLHWLQELWSDPAQFDAIVASGRYLKLCALLEWASANVDAASWRLEQVAASATSNECRRAG